MNYSATFFIVLAILFVSVSSQVTEEKKYKVVCYFTNWSFYRTGNGKFLPSNIDPNLCTNIVYAFTFLDANSLTIKISDSYVDIDNHLYKQITDFREKGINVSVAIGGGGDSVGPKYKRLLTNANARRKFIANVTNFITKYNFQGLDLDLEYPACWQGTCLPANSAQKAAFGEFVKELSEAFKPRGWLLSAAVSAFYTVIDGAYDVPTLAKYLDWIAVMAYDFHGTWDKKTGPNAPLFNYPGNNINNYADYGIKYWMKLGAPSEKLILGAPTYGITYTLTKATNHGLNAPVNGSGFAGQFTQTAGILAYYEICSRLKNKKWTTVSNSSIGAYAFFNKQWISFDDVKTMSFKSKYIRDEKLGGAMVWTLDFDDFRGICGKGKYPLLTALNQGLRN